MAREKQAVLSQGSISYILRHNELDKKKSSMFQFDLMCYIPGMSKRQWLKTGTTFQAEP